MARHLVSEQQVKNALKIDSFRNLSKDKIMEFVSLIPNMDKEVAIAIVNQFPEYVGLATSMVEQLNVICDDILSNNDASQKEVVSAYKKILDDLGEILKKDNISEDQRQQITKDMIDIADRISAKDTENKKFLERIYKYGASIIGGALILGAVILGVNVKGKQLPCLDDNTDDNDTENDEYDS